MCSGCSEFPNNHTDLDSTHWAYADIMEASNGHLYDRNDNGKETWTDKLLNETEITRDVR